MCACRASAPTGPGRAPAGLPSRATPTLSHRTPATLRHCLLPSTQVVETFDRTTFLQREVLPLRQETVTDNLPWGNKDQDAEATVLATATDAFVIVRGTEGSSLFTDWQNTNLDMADTQIGCAQPHGMRCSSCGSAGGRRSSRAPAVRCLCGRGMLDTAPTSGAGRWLPITRPRLAIPPLQAHTAHRAGVAGRPEC